MPTAYWDSEGYARCHCPRCRTELQVPPKLGCSPFICPNQKCSSRFMVLVKRQRKLSRSTPIGLVEYCPDSSTCFALTVVDPTLPPHPAFWVIEGLPELPTRVTRTRVFCVTITALLIVASIVSYVRNWTSWGETRKLDKNSVVPTGSDRPPLVRDPGPSYSPNRLD
jgi:hypothetical protein